MKEKRTTRLFAGDETVEMYEDKALLHVMLDHCPCDLDEDFTETICGSVVQGENNFGVCVCCWANWLDSVDPVLGAAKVIHCLETGDPTTFEDLEVEVDEKEL